MTTPDPVPAIEARHEEYVWTGEEHVVHFVGQIHRDRATLLAIVRELRAENERLKAEIESLRYEALETEARQDAFS